MNIFPRTYRDAKDLQKMCALLQTGCTAQTNAYYVHLGELNLCLFNWLDGHDPWQHIYLWEDPADPEYLLGWALLSTPWSAFDVFVRPELWNSAWAADVNAWVEEKSTAKACEQGHRHIWRMNVAESDSSLREHLCGRGFQEVPGDAMLSLACTLDRELTQPFLPEGYTVRQVDETDTVNRAAAQHAAFQIDTPFQEYLQRYSHFMASPGYARGFDWIVVAPDRRVAAFCIVWPDAVSRIGQIEPVGTHPDFQRKGLGKAVMRAGLQHLQSVGVCSARICARADNVAAIKLYESVGFRTMYQLLTYRKTL
jgi:ribosomal protein S18 acetylase RimI-like enzyme